MRNPSSLNLRKIVFISLFTALIILGGYLSFPIPFSPVPIVASDLFAVLSGLVLGASGGFFSVALFLFLGALGLPVFAGGKAGLAVLLGPTGGFLLGYLIGVLIIGFISTKNRSTYFKDLLALIAGYFVIFGIGLLWLKTSLNITWAKALALGLLPFLIGTVLKIVVAFAIMQILRPILAELFPTHTYRG